LTQGEISSVVKKNDKCNSKKNGKLPQKQEIHAYALLLLKSC
jgi:hypothetical protein